DYVRVPKTLAEGHTAAISAKAAHPSAAKLFENFLISREGMEIMARQGEFVTAKGIFPPIKDADKITTVAIDELSSEDFTKWAAGFRPLFVARWEGVRTVGGRRRPFPAAVRVDSIALPRAGAAEGHRRDPLGFTVAGLAIALAFLCLYPTAMLFYG